MSTTSQFNLQIIDSEIYTNAVKLSEIQKYTEKKNTLPYHLCDSLLVNHTKREFWFTDNLTANNTINTLN